MKPTIPVLGVDGWTEVEHPGYEGTLEDWIHNDRWRPLLTLGSRDPSIALYTSERDPRWLIVIHLRGDHLEFMTHTAQDAIGVLAHWTPIVHQVEARVSKPDRRLEAQIERVANGIENLGHHIENGLVVKQK